MSQITESPLAQHDKRYLWHPFTQQQSWEQQTPLIITAAEGNYLIAEDGRRYLDGVSSLWLNVHGHCHPTINAAIARQLEQLAHSTLLGLSHPPAITLARRLVELTPPSLSRVFYSDSGSTAVEVALKMAFQYWQLRGLPSKTAFIALEDAYHGDTIGAVSVGGIDAFHQIFHPLLFSTRRIPRPARRAIDSPDRTDALLAERSLAELDRQLADADKIAALVIEPRVQGASGMLIHSADYLRAVADRCARADVLLIVDEVATGFGRTGTMFASESAGINPDLMAIAKGLTAGYLPLAATLTTERVYRTFLGERERTFFHGHSYTGNPLACAAALASLDLFRDNDLLASVRQRAKELGALLAQRLETHPRVGQIRQLGLMTAVELVASREPLQPYPPDQSIGAKVCLQARQHGVILRPLGDAIILMPPLSITSAQLELLVDALALTLDEIL